MNFTNNSITMNNITNQTFELYKENDKYYLKVDFDYEDEFRICRGHVDKLEFDLCLSELSFRSQNTPDGIKRQASVTFKRSPRKANSIISFDATEDSKGNLITIEVIKEKACEMTIEEIEKKLGHKIKIISKQKGIIL